MHARTSAASLAAVEPSETISSSLVGASAASLKFSATFRAAFHLHATEGAGQGGHVSA